MRCGLLALAVVFAACGDGNGPQPPAQAVVDTTPPIITLTGDNPQIIPVGDAYAELGATAMDDRDGDLTDAITIDHSAVDTGTIGSYEVMYDVEDSSGNHATTVVRTVNVEAPPVVITWYRDVDQDGYSNGDTEVAAARPPGYYEESELTAIFGDCDDADVSVNPAANDIDADGIDQDCNGFEISGPPEVVFDWTTDRCDDLDIPDLPARAFVDKDGQVQLISSHYDVRRSIGPDLDNLVHDCMVVMTSHRDPDPANFNDSEWIGATYTEDGTTIYAIVHNEYHAWEHPGQCSLGPEFSPECLYNGLTLAVSTDAGQSYDHPIGPPLHLVASYPEQYQPDQGPYGMFHPSNIIKGDDGLYYALIDMVRPGGDHFSCLMRTMDLADPDSWRFWGGQRFDGEFINAYTEAVADPSDHICATVDPDDIPNMFGSLTYSEYLDRYVLLSPNFDGETWGFFYSLSEDLLDWTLRAPLLERRLPWSGGKPGDVTYQYPSFLDTNSMSRNFETIGKTAYVYYTRHNFGNSNLDRDMLRVPIEFFRY